MSRRRRSSEEGATTMELALLTPVMLLIVIFTVQLAMWFHARHVAIDAAQEGARVARTEIAAAGSCARPQWECDAENRARADAAQIGRQLLDHASFTAIDQGQSRGVEVRGQAVSVLPGLTFSVLERSVGPIECFRPDNGTGACAP